MPSTSTVLNCYAIILGILLYQQEKILLTNAESFDRMIDVHYRMCPKTSMCNGTKLYDGTSCCQSCQCLDSCIHYYSDTCCPDKLASLLEQNYGALPVGNSVCTLYRFRKDFVGRGIMMVRSCPASFDNKTVYDNCLMHHNFSLEDTAPVTSRYDNVTFYNIFCALCNGLTESDVLRWPPGTIECEEGYFFPESKASLLLDIWDTRCNVVYSPPENVDLVAENCEAWISQCNITGMWPNYDEYIHTACRSYTSVYNMYLNPFCYLCNSAENVISACSDVHSYTYLVSFSAVLNFADDKSEPTDGSDRGSYDSICQESFVYDPYQMKCMEVHCYYGRRYHNGTCQQEVLLDISHLSYKIYIGMTPITQTQEQKLEETAEFLYDDLNSILLADHHFYVCRKAMYYQQVNTTNATSSYFLYELEVAPSNGMHRQVAAFVETVLNLDQTTQIITSAQGSMTFHVVLNADTINSTDEDGIRKTEHELRTIQKNDGDSIDMCPEDRSQIVITRVMRCPLIQLNQNNFNLEYIGSGLYIKELNFFLSLNEVLIKSHDKENVFICMDTYIQAATGTANRNSKSDIVSETPVALVQYLTFICMILSIVCLSITLFTYLWFPVLRTQPGINNIILSSALIIAQCMFQFSVGAKKDVPHWACVCFGIITHFSWLYTVFSMNVCSIHMTRVFRNTQLQDKINKTKTTILYNMYTVLSSSFFCVMNISVVYFRSDGGSFGYGETDKCYISSNLMLGLTFALPVGIVVLTNLCLFILTVVGIANIQDVSAVNKQSRNQLLIFARLSTVTGLTWAFGFLYSFTSLDVFEYFFVVLNAGQGVFIMMAFVMNNRVQSMYKSCLCKW